MADIPINPTHPDYRQESFLFTSLQTYDYKIPSTSRNFQTRSSDPAHSKFSKAHPTTKDNLAGVNPLYPSTHTRRVKGPIDGGPYPSDIKECGRTGVSSAQDDEHQDQVVVNGRVHPVS